jgi:prepilin-type N-terminal cleavage/methylation domain-containing protein
MKKQSPRGFTLIELVIVVALIAFIGTMALQSYFDSTDKFGFLSQYREAVSIFRTVRSDAVNNRQVAVVGDEPGEVSQELPSYYGVYIAADCLATFADVAQGEDAEDLQFDMPADFTLSGGAGFCSLPAVQDPAKDKVLKAIDLGAQGLRVEAYPSSTTEVQLQLPLVAYYQTGSGNLTLFENVLGEASLLAKTTDKFVTMKFFQADDVTNQQFMALYQVSGLAEELTGKQFNEIYGL